MSIFKKSTPSFFSKEEEKQIVAAIKTAELKTSGEVRVHLDDEEIEDIKERAVFVFDSLGMKKTKDRNGILLYINPKTKKFLVIGDEGIHEKVGQDFWEKISVAMKSSFSIKAYAPGVINAINDIGSELLQHFPYDKQTDENELDDEISYKV